MSHHIMIDLETLGTTADAVILSIGAVRFDLDAGTVDADDTFYAVLNIESQDDRHVSRDTLAWWMQQSPEAAAVLTHQPKVPLRAALRELAEFIKRDGIGGLSYCWSNGADFDLPMLSHAYAQHDMAQPWPAYFGRCYRTYKNLPGAKDVKVLRDGVAHNALGDAIYQARHLCAIHRALFMVSLAEPERLVNEGVDA